MTPPTEPGWYNDPEGRYSHQAYWDGERWTGQTRLPFGRVRGANRWAGASVYAGAIGSILTVSGWSIQGSLFEGERATALMIVAGIILGFIALALILVSFLAGRDRDVRVTRRARRYGFLLSLIAISPVLYLGLLLGALAEGL